MKRRPIIRELLPLVPVMALSALAGTVYSLSLTEFVIMPDELGYVKQAVEMAHGELVAPGDFWFNSWAQLHPLLMAPFYRWLNTVHAFDANHVVNAVVMSTTAVPAYLLARRATPSRTAAYLVATITVAVPWIAMAGSMMTETVAYPAFTWAVLAMAHAVERPGPRSDLLVLAGLALAFVARTQFLILAPAFVAAALAHALLYEVGHGPGLRARLAATARGHRLFLTLSALGALGLLISASPERFLGGYAEPTHGSLFPPGSAAAARELVVYVVGAIGVIPLVLAASWVVTTIGRPTSEREHAAATVILLVTVVMTSVAGAFTVRFTAGINDRYLFYVIPPLLAAAAGALSRPASRSTRVALAGAGIGVTWLCWTSLIAQQGPSLVAPSMAFHTVMWERAADLGTTAPHLLAWVTAIATVVLVALLGRRLVLPAVLGVLLVYSAIGTQYTMRKVADTQAGSAKEFQARRGWVDRALPQNAHAATILASLGEPLPTSSDWWDVSFWNAKVRAVYCFPQGTHYEQGFVRSLDIDPETGRIPVLDSFRYLIRPGHDTRFGLRGSTTVANDGALLIIEAERPYRAEWMLDGPNRDAGIVPPGSEAKLRVFAADGKTVQPPAEVTLRALDGEVAFAIGSAGDHGTSAADLRLDKGEQGKFPIEPTDLPYTEVTLRVKPGAGSLYLVGVSQG